MDREVKRLLLIVMLMCYLAVPGWLFYEYRHFRLLAWFGPILAGFIAGMMSRSVLSALFACLLTSGITVLLERFGAIPILGWSLIGFFIITSLLLVGVALALVIRELHGNRVPFRKPSTC
jgi:hypothetical protein